MFITPVVLQAVHINQNACNKHVTGTSESRPQLDFKCGYDIVE
jgi:hypothetical protein